MSRRHEGRPPTLIPRWAGGIRGGYCQVYEYGLVCRRRLKRRYVRACSRTLHCPITTKWWTVLAHHLLQEMGRPVPLIQNPSTIRTLPKSVSSAYALASLLDGSTAGKLIPELATRDQQRRIELEVYVLLWIDKHDEACRRARRYICHGKRISGSV